MSKKANPALVGAFVLAALALLIAVVVYFGSGTYGGNWYRFNIYFQGNAAGLQVGAPVVLKGVRIGQVSSVQVGFYPEDGDFIVPVEVKVDGDRILWSDRLIEAKKEADLLKELIDLGLRARLDMQSLVTGQLRIDLGFFPDTEIVFRGRDSEVPEIPSIPSALDELFSALQDFPIERLAASSLKVIEGLDQLINSPTLPRLLDEMNATLLDARRLLTTLQGGAEPAAEKLLLFIDELQQLAGRGETVLDEVSRLFETVGGDTHRLLKKLDRDLTPAIVSMRKAAGSAESAFRAADSTFRSADEMIGTESPLRHELLTLMRNLTDAARSLKSMADYLERHPDALLQGKR